MPNVTVIGLSDVGRSPRFQYHCISFAQEGYYVNVIGYKGAKPKRQLSSDPNVSITYLATVPEFNKHLPRILAYFFKVLWQSLTVLWALILKRSDYVFVQTPPAIPVLAVAWFYALIVRAKFIIDWHNYAYSIMALTLGEKSVLVKISYWFECFFGRKAHANLCVTKAMKLDLMSRWAIMSTVLYDKAPDEFRRTSIEERHLLFTRLSQSYSILGGSLHSTAFTKMDNNGQSILRPDRPALLVSSTSWTEDEDFNILLSALIIYDKSERDDLPKLICVITGRGPLKEHYIGIIQATKWNKVSIITPWLEEQDYPLLLGSADLGVSLHTSSSGLDLPMKVVDMFGCGLAVLAHDFKCVHELVRHGQNGLVFKDAFQLSSQLIDWFANFPDGPRRYNFNKSIQAFGGLRWHQNWTQKCLPVFRPSQS